MLTIESLRDLIRDRGIATQNGASDLSLFGATSQTFPQWTVGSDSVSLTSVHQPQLGEAVLSSNEQSYDLSAQMPGSGGFWASLFGPLPSAQPTSILFAAPLAPVDTAGHKEASSVDPADAQSPAQQVAPPISSSPLVVMTDLMGPQPELPGIAPSPVESVILAPAASPQDMLATISEAMVQPAAAPLPDTVVVMATDLIGSIPDALTLITAPTGDSLGDLGQVMSQSLPVATVQQLPATIADVTDTLVSTGSTLLVSSAEVTADVVDLVDDAVTPVTTIVAPVVDTVVAPVTKTVSFLGESVAPIVETLIPSTAPNLIAPVASIISDLPVAELAAGPIGGVATSVQTVVEEIADEGVPAVEQLTDTVVPDTLDTTTQIVSAVASLPSTVTGSSSDATSQASLALAPVEAIAPIAQEPIDQIADDIVPAVGDLTEAAIPDVAETAAQIVSDATSLPATTDVLGSESAATSAVVAPVATIAAALDDTLPVAALAMPAESNAGDEPLSPLGGADVPAGIAVLTDLLTADSQFAIQDQATGAPVFAPAPSPAELVTEFADLGTGSAAHDAPDPVDHLLHDDSPLGGTLGHLFDNDGGLHG